MIVPPKRGWAAEIAALLREEAAVRAVRIDATGRKVFVATVGEADVDLLRQKLEDVLRAIDNGELGVGQAPQGFTIADAGTALQLSRETCISAPRFWRWREFAWPENETEEEPEWRLLAVLAVSCGVLGAAAFTVDRTGLGPSWLATLLYALSIVAGGWDAAIDAWNVLRRGRLDVHFLMLAVAGAAAAIGAWGEGALLLFLFSLSGALEDYALHRTHRDVRALLRAAPKTTTRVRPDGAIEEVPVTDVAVGWTLLVRPGDTFPVDGVVIQGATAADESTLTGESVPVSKSIGDEVASGTLNLWGAVRMRVTRIASQSMLQRIIRMIRTAQRLRAPSQRFTDRFGTGYTVGVLGFCTAMFFVWWLGFGLPAFSLEGGLSAFYRAMTLLVVMSPCALVLSIPSAILAAIAWGARHGILFRGGAAIEKLAQVDVVALDKTGTLTTGELRVVGVESYPEGREADVLGAAYALERNSQHPLARAIVAHGRRLGLAERRVEDFRSLTGIGIVGSTDGSRVAIGRRELVARGELADLLERVAPAPEDTAEVWVVLPDTLGRILLRDEVRPASRLVLDALREWGVHTVMLTGDRRASAEKVARELGVAECRAGLRPEDKVDAVRGWLAAGRRIAMIGDGVNDAPSLAAAHVGVAMGARGSDAALEQADVVLMHDRIDNFLAALALSRRACSVIRQNIAISLGTVVVMAVASMLGPIPLSLGVAAHEGSTVLVCLNSLRLLLSRGPGLAPRGAGLPQASGEV